LRAIDFNIRDVILLGGAMRRKKKGWLTITENIQGKLYNFYNRDDKVLSLIYKIAEFRTDSPCGQKPIDIDKPNVKNINMTGVFKKRKVDQHLGYWDILDDMLKSEGWPE
jgi:hypothetical protein